MAQDLEAVLARGLGALLGQAVGDALGTTVEFQPSSAIRQRFPDGLREIQGGGPFHLLPGQVTDDTELALALARSLARKGAYDEEDVAVGYLAWYRSGPFDVGRATWQAFSGPVGAGESVARQVEARANPKTEANGSLMRSSPLGIFGWRLEAGPLAEAAARDSRLSHPNPVCQAACVVFTRAIAYAVGEGGTPEAVYRHALEFARSDPRAAAVVDSLEAAAREPPGDFESKQGWVRVAFQNAFHRLLHARDPEEGIVATVMCGGDTDTNGSIAGALLGSVHGVGAIPGPWREAVLGCRSRRPTDYHCADLPRLAERLCFPGEPAVGQRT